MNAVASEAPIRDGPSTSSARTSIGTGGTTDIHSVRWSGFGARACRLQMLPIAQPSAPQRVRTTGIRAAVWPRWAAMAASPATATTMPTTCRRVSRSRRKIPASSTVNGAEACSTSEASPLGMPAAMPR